MTVCAFRTYSSSSGPNLANTTSSPAVSGRPVESGGKGWRTADAVGLYSHYPLGLGEADTQCLPMSNFVSAMSRNR